MYREVTMIELKEVLRLRGEGLPKKRLAAQLGLDPKTVRRYLSVAASVGVQAGAGPVTDEQLRDVLLALHPTGGRPRGDSWDRCVTQRMAIERWLRDGLRLTKIRKLLARQDVVIPYPTLHRFAVLEGPGTGVDLACFVGQGTGLAAVRAGQGVAQPLALLLGSGFEGAGEQSADGGPGQLLHVVQRDVQVGALLAPGLSDNDLAPVLGQAVNTLQVRGAG